MSKPQILSSIPGRVRLHLPNWLGNGQRLLEQRVRALPGVKRVETNSLTGNILIGFDPHTTNESTLLSALNNADRDTAGRPEDKPLPPVIDESGSGSLHQAHIAVRGLDRDPRVARKVLERLRNLFGVLVRASMLTGRILVEYDAEQVDLHELLARVADVELPDLPGEDRPAHPLDMGPLLHAATRTIGAALGLGVIVIRRLAGRTAPSRQVKIAATSAGIIGLLRSFPSLRNGLRRLFGPHAADLIFSSASAFTLALAGSPLGLTVTGLEGLLLLTEVMARRSSWRRYEENLHGTAAAEPGAVIRLEAGERLSLSGEVIEGTGTAIGRDGLPRQIAPGAHLSAGAEVSGGPFVIQLQGGKPFAPQPRPAPPNPNLYSRYARLLGPISLGYAGLTAFFTRTFGSTFEAMLLVNPRTAIIGMEAANLDAAARVVRAGVTVVGTRPNRTIRLPDVLLLDGPRVLTDGLEITTVLPLDETVDASQVLELAAGVSAAAGSPWGSVFAATGNAPAAEGIFNGLWAAASVQGVRYTLGPPEDRPAIGEAVEKRHEGGYLLMLSRSDDWRPLGFVTLRPRLHSSAENLVQTCRRLGVRLEMLAAGAPNAAQPVARRAGVTLVDSADAVAVIDDRQRAGQIVAFVSDSAQAAAGLADCALGIGLAPSPNGQFPARADLLAPDLDAVAAVLEAGARRERSVRDAVGFSLAANVFGAVWGWRGRPGVERASNGVHIGALAALADGWLRLRGGQRLGSSLSQLVDPHPERWGRQNIPNVLRVLKTSETGLSSVLAKQRQDMTPRAVNGQAMIRALLDEMRSPVNSILTGGALLSLIAGGAALDIVIIGATVAINITVAVWQERQAGKAVEALRGLGTTTARVLRDGDIRTVPATDVVQGDVLLLAPGDRVAADARLLQAQSFEMDEAALTGESIPVVKHAEGGTPEGRVVLEGSGVVVGTGRALVVAVGRQTRMGATAAALSLDEIEQSPFGARLARLLQLALPIAAVGGATVIVSGILWGKPLVTQVSVGASIALAVVPESLPLLAGTGQVGVARRLARRRALMRRLAAVESLGRVDVACTDKTGTLTEGRLAVRLVASFSDKVTRWQGDKGIEIPAGTIEQDLLTLSPCHLVTRVKRGTAHGRPGQSAPPSRG